MAVVVRNVVKVYGSGNAAVEALRGVDLEIARGEILMLVGPSGSGKTTLLSIVGCVLSPTSGQIVILDRDVSRLPEKKLPDIRLGMIGFVFQGNNLINSLDALSNVRLPLLMRGVSMAAATREAEALLDRVSLADKHDRKPGDLSGGQRQRVAIARALAGTPPIILADEPTAALDAATGQSVMNLLRDLARERGITVGCVTHDNRIYQYADRIVEIEDGRIQHGEPSAEHAR